MPRIKIIKLIYVFVISVVILRLGYWQIIKAEELSAKADFQRYSSTELKAPRGVIKFSDGSLLAGNQPTYLVFIQPKLIEFETKSESLANLYKREFSKKVAQVFLELDLKNDLVENKDDPKSVQVHLDEIEKFIENNLSRDLHWVSLGRKVNFETKQLLERLDLTGLGFESNSSRFYPEGSSSAHLLGFIGSDIYGNDTGYFGLEGFYNGDLKGKKGKSTLEKDALGLPILIGNFLERDAKAGKTLELSIDRTVQHTIEKYLKIGMQKYGAKGGSVLVMDPHTGNILGMASLPSYDPNSVLQYPKENFRNPITADSYEPGSTFKVLVMAAAINEGLITPETICDICDSPVQIGEYTIKTWNNKYQKNATMTDVIIHSDNTGMVYVGRKLGLDKMYSYLQKFGFGELTGIDLQDESTPFIRAKKDWKEIDLATSTFGQGISVTQLQLLRAVSSIANGGNLFEPHIVKKIIDYKKVQEIKPVVVGSPISKDAAAKVTEMMVKAVDFGESKFAKPKGYKVAGKTGTAQIPVEGHYDAQRTIASFVGFAPADDPKFVMLVRYVEPSSSIFGSETAAPTFFEIARDLFNYYGIVPTQ